MVEKIFNLFSSISPLFALFIISLVPLIEERGALIFAASIAIDWKLAMPICIISNFLPVPFLLLFGTKIIHWLKKTKTFGSFFTKYDEKLHVKSEKYKKYGFSKAIRYVLYKDMLKEHHHLLFQRLIPIYLLKKIIKNIIGEKHYSSLKEVFGR